MNSIAMRIVGENRNVYCKRYSLFSLYDFQECCLFSLIFCFLFSLGKQSPDLIHSVFSTCSINIVCETDREKQQSSKKENMLEQSILQQVLQTLDVGISCEMISLFFLNKISFGEFGMFLIEIVPNSSGKQQRINQGIYP